MPINNRPVWYLQTDPKWSKWPYSNKDEKTNIGESGCGPSSMAMVLATWVDPTITPLDTCKWALSKGYKATGNGTYHSYFIPQAKAYGLQCEKLNGSSLQYMTKAQRAVYDQKAKAYVDDGNLVIALMGPGNWTTCGHYVLWYANQGNNVYINDPASKKETRHVNTFALFTSQSRYYWVIHVPKEVISMTNIEVAALIDQKLAAYAPKQDASAVPSEWAKKAWYAACEAGLFDKTAPKGNLTREQLAAILSRIHTAGIDLDKVVIPENFDFSTWKVGAANPNPPVEEPVTPPQPETPKYEEYVVKSGDSFWKIAKAVYGNGSMYTKILADNNMKSTDMLHPGNILKIYK